QREVADRLGAERAARLAREHNGDAQPLEPVRQQSGVGRLAGAFTALEGDEAPAHRYSRWKPARNRLITSSVAASRARRGIEPVGTLSVDCSGTSSTSESPRQTFSMPIFWPCCTGAGTGPV